MRAKHKKLAFSLLELSIVVAVVSILVGGMLNIAAQNIREKKQAELQMKMDAIEQALIGFRKANNRLPCPADGSLAISLANFGKEAATPGTCTGVRFSSGNVVGGVVPTRTLGLADEYAFDPWGGKFSYVIDKDATAASAFASVPPSANLTGSNVIRTAAPPSGVVIANGSATVVLISHGQNGHGAYQLSGVRKNGGSTNTEELKNCHCNNAGVATAFDNIFIQAPPTGTGLNAYDDITRYYTRADFLSASDMLTEK